MPQLNLLSDFYDAIVFITRRHRIPKPVLVDAAAAAERIVNKFISERSTENRACHEGKKVTQKISA